MHIKMIAYGIPVYVCIKKNLNVQMWNLLNINYKINYVYNLKAR